MPTPRKSLTTCPCGGTGLRTVPIPISNGIVSATLQCSIHHRHAAMPARTRVYDTDTGRIGEVMDATTTNHGTTVSLRPVGGGVEWPAAATALQTLGQAVAQVQP